MKKVMFATALAAFCGAVLADSIESQNTVGYQTAGLARGEFNYRVATFLPTDKAPDEMTLGDLNFQNLKVSGIQILQDGGETLVLDETEYPLIELDPGDELYAQFDYIPASTAGANGEGWYLSQDGDYAYNMNDWVVPFGQQYVVDCGDKNMSVTDAGEVAAEDLEFDVERGTFNYFGNCSPVEITLGDLTFQNLKVSGLQILQDGGETLVLDETEYPLIELDPGDELYAQFDYIPAATAGANGAGWYLSQDGDYAYNMNDWVIESGAGFVIDCGDKNMTVIIPSAL